MDFNKYQIESRKTAIYPNQNTITGILYCALGLGEAGEVQGKVKKILRDDGEVLTEERKMMIVKEMGDVLWYLANLATELKIEFNNVALYNLGKLECRDEEDKLKGDGDDR